jgi:nucleotide-binding universal stress UspA family protein
MSQRTVPDAVVVGCDGSWQSQAAVATATREAALRGLSLVLLAVARVGAVADGLSELRRSEGIAEERARAVAKRAAGVAHETDPQVRVEMVVTASLDTSAALALAGRAALLVLGGHGSGGQRALSLGSTSDAVAHWARSPVMVPGTGPDARSGRPPEGEREPVVLVGVAGERADGDLLRYAAQEAALRRTPLRVVHAVPRPASEVWLADRLEVLWRQVRDVPETVDVPCQVEVVHEDPTTALLSRSRRDDVLVVGTRGGGTLAGLIHGSVARGVLDAATCDVVVVPPGALVGSATPPAPAEVGRVR